MNKKLVGAALAACCAAVAQPAFAAGFYFGDNGSKPMTLGGAFVAHADDLTAINYNPAGLTQLQGFQFLIDSDLLTHDVTFDRRDSPFDPAVENKFSQTVRNTGGLFWLPFIGLGYGLKLFDRPLTIAAGVYGPPAVGRYQYAVPDYTKEYDANRNPPGEYYVQDPRRFAPQRYGLVRSNLVVAYPSLSVAYAPHRIVQLGASLQLVYSSFTFAQTVYSGLSTPARQSQEDPSFDTFASAELVGGLTVTGIFGLMVRPVESLSLGASLRPNIPITARGKIDFELGEVATALNAQVNGDQGELKVEMPLEIRAGASWKPLSMLRINADFVYQGWQSIQELGVTPQQVTLTLGGGEPQTVGTIAVRKEWMPSYSWRLGVSVDVLKKDWFALSLNAGGFYETATAKPEYANIDFLHFNRVFITGGAVVGLGPIDLVLGVSGTPTQTLVVQNSELRAGSSDTLVPGAVVGNGVYTSGGWGLLGGLRGNFGAERMPKKAPAAEAPKPEETK